MRIRALSSPGWTIFVSSLASMAAVLGPAACGNTSTNGSPNLSDAATDSQGTGLDAGGPVATEAGASDAPTGAMDAAVDAPVDAPAEAFDAPFDAPPEASEASTCPDLPPDLPDAALAQFRTVVEQNLSCSEDTDCVWANGGCVDPCGVVTDQAGMAAVQTGAQQACEAYNAACPAPISVECADAGPLVCSAGSCTTSLFVTSSAATLTHGVCQAFELGFRDYFPNGYGLPQEAPDDLAIPVSGISNATLYADSSCTTPLTGQAITIPAGASQVTFSVLPTTAGTCSFTVSQVDHQYTVQ
jgi:hypothetical protein